MKIDVEIEETTKIIESLYRYCLKREAGSNELKIWTDIVQRGMPISRVIEEFGNCDEYRNLFKVVPFFNPGHYHSPVVSPDEKVRAYMYAQAERVGRSPIAIDMHVEEMKEVFAQNVAFMSSNSFQKDKNSKHRYYHDNNVYPLGDAITLRMMLNLVKPRRIIEIGSGFSTACMLDSSEEIGLVPEITCIEPYPERLKSLLRPTDRVDIFESPVQDVSLDRFKALEKNDILFIDSTHVLKAGSDVHYELFEILPVLKSGVFVHFHDLTFPFEYPLEWVFETNFSWNETYAVRAFLMYNKAFVPFYSSSLLLQVENAFVKKLYPDFPLNPGSNLWVVRAT
jgi:predicted O-methyltransferase YrrM